MSRFRAAIAAAAALCACVPTERTNDGGVRLGDAAVFRDGRAPEDSGAPDPDSGTGDGGPTDRGLADTGAPPPADRDGDGIPDGEDPQPDRVNPSLFHDLFDGAVQEWIFSSVSMSIDEFTSVLRVNVLEPVVREGWIGPKPAWSDYFARTNIRVLEVGDADTLASGRAGMIARVNQVSPDRYLFCAIDFKLNRVVLTAHNGGTPPGTELASAPITAQLGEWLPMTMGVSAEAISCSIGGVSIEGTSNVVTNGSIGFRAFDATFESDFIDVYDL